MHQPVYPQGNLQPKFYMYSFSTICTYHTPLSFLDFINVTVGNLLEDYRFIVERRFLCPNDLESYSGGSVSS
jgi:hypothetical protein